MAKKKRIIGYKAFSIHLTCREMQYEIGKTYKMDATPVPCRIGYHFCMSIADCYRYYPMYEDTRICKVEALGEVITDDNIKFVTNEIKILSEVKNPREKSNARQSSSGFCNRGSRNSGNWNFGHYNSGHYNSGQYNSGDHNSGYCNSGNCNSGDHNSGSFNFGHKNSGYYNSGGLNSGDYNSGFYNSGDYNSGDYNSGSFNAGNHHSGVFNTETNPCIRMFDMESGWTLSDWYGSAAYTVMSKYPYSHIVFEHIEDMSNEEKEDHPECTTIGGYVKTIVVTAEDKQKWWDELYEEDKSAVLSLPNFDAEKFYLCTEIRV